MQGLKGRRPREEYSAPATRTQFTVPSRPRFLPRAASNINVCRASLPATVPQTRGTSAADSRFAALLVFSVCVFAAAYLVVVIAGAVLGWEATAFALAAVVALGVISRAAAEAKGGRR